MVKVVTNELIGPALDWAAGIAEGLDLEVRLRNGNKQAYVVWLDPFTITLPNRPVFHDKSYRTWAPSTDGAQGALLLHKHAVWLKPSDPYAEFGGTWTATCITNREEAAHTYCHAEGETPLIAGMRAIVGANLGDIIEMPAELLEQKA